MLNRPDLKKRTGRAGKMRVVVQCYTRERDRRDYFCVSKYEGYIEVLGLECEENGSDEEVQARGDCGTGVRSELSEFSHAVI